MIAPKRPAGRTFLLTRKPVSWSELSSVAARIMQKRAAGPTDSFAAGVRRGRLRGGLVAADREAGDHLAREG